PPPRRGPAWRRSWGLSARRFRGAARLTPLRAVPQSKLLCLSRIWKVSGPDAAAWAASSLVGWLAMPRRRTKRGADRTPLSGDADVLICGASFAGLAVARELAGSGARVLMIDRYEIGERQTSACAAPTGWLEALGLQASMRQTFPELVIHTPHATARYELPWTFSTFDYRTLCELLDDQNDASFETAKVDGRTGFTVHPHGESSDLEIWIDRKYVPAGYGWSFPARDEIRIGVGSFDPRFHVKDTTVELAEDLDREAVRTRGIGSRTGCATPRPTASSSWATPPATACR